MLQDAPEGVHKPSDRQLNKSSAASSHLDSASSRRSSSAPSSAVASAQLSQLSQQTQPLTQQSTLTTSNKTSDRDPSALTTATSLAIAEKLTEKTNAETQTALRGVAILEGECGHAHTTSFGHAHFSGSSPRVHEEAVFFTECECNLQSKSTVAHNQNTGSTGAKVGVATIAAPVVLPAVHVGTSGHGNNKHHSMSMPNVATLVPRPSSSRRDRQTTVGNFTIFYLKIKLGLNINFVRVFANLLED